MDKLKKVGTKKHNVDNYADLYTKRRTIWVKLIQPISYENKKRNTFDDDVSRLGMKSESSFNFTGAEIVQTYLGGKKPREGWLLSSFEKFEQKLVSL